tara:strand:- start:148 stop:855 length:708 start_codon:yes stop_codon:yes gene_type:complete
MARLPTNAKLFGEYLAGKKDPITEKDFTPQELSEMLRMIEQQDTRNVEEEEGLQRSLTSYQKNLETFDPNKNLVQDEKGNLVPKYTEKEYNKEVQANIKNVERQLASYEKTRDKTAVGYREERADPEGLKIVDAISQSFTSPAYNIETTLGNFSARKNKNGTVSIKDTYDFLGYGNEKPVKLTMSDFLKALPAAITKPEAFGTLISRAFLADRKRDVDITLDSKAKTAKTFKEAL